MKKCLRYVIKNSYYNNMSQILTDDEIQQLLAAISSPQELEEKEDSKDTDSRKVRIYDFKRPDKFTKLEINFLAELLSDFASNLSAQICQNYQMVYEPKITLEILDVLSWDNYINSLSKDGFLSYYSDWFDGKVALTCDLPAAMNNLYDNTESKHTGKKSISLKSEEINKFADAILSNALFLFDFDLYRKLPGKPERDEDLESRFLSNPKSFFNTREPSMALYAGFSVDGLNSFSMAIDSSALRKYLDAYNGKEKKQNKLSASNFGDVKVHVSALLGQTDKKLEDLVGLGPGAIIELDKKAGEPVDIVVGNKTIAKGEVVVYGDTMAVRLVEVV